MFLSNKLACSCFCFFLIYWPLLYLMNRVANTLKNSTDTTLSLKNELLKNVQKCAETCKNVMPPMVYGQFIAFIKVNSINKYSAEFI